MVCSCSEKSGSGLCLDSSGTTCNYKGITVKVGVSGNLPWKAHSDSSRVMIAPSSASGDCRVSITVPPTSSKKVHDLHVWFTCLTDTSRRACFTIRQDAVPYLEFEKDTVVVPYAGDTLSIALLSNVEWILENKIIIDPTMTNHILMSPIEGSGDTSLSVIVPVNPRKRQRTMAPVMIMKDEPGQRATLTIIQTKD